MFVVCDAKTGSAASIQTEKHVHELKEKVVSEVFRSVLLLCSGRKAIEHWLRGWMRVWFRRSCLSMTPNLSSFDGRRTHSTGSPYLYEVYRRVHKAGFLRSLRMCRNRSVRLRSSRRSFLTLFIFSIALLMCRTAVRQMTVS